MLICDNKYIPSEDKDFFILLRIGLWQKVEEELSPNPDWEYIYKLATEQTVQGIITDGIGLYRKQYPDLNITQEQNERFLNITAQIIKRNYAVNQLQARICQLFSNSPLKGENANQTPPFKGGREGLSYVILKGQAVAQCYPKPMLRACGDIDYLLPLDHYLKAQEILSETATKVEPEEITIRQIEMYFDDQKIELHASVSPSIGRTIGKVLKAEQDKLFHNGIQTADISGAKVKIPNRVFHTFYIFLHCLQHYYRQELGLRQICDFAMIASTISEEERMETVRLVEQCRLQKEYNALLVFAQEYLEGSINHGVQQSHSNSKTIWTSVKRYGNMGHNTTNTPNLLDKLIMFVANARISPRLTFRYIGTSIYSYCPQKIKMSIWKVKNGND